MSIPDKYELHIDDLPQFFPPGEGNRMGIMTIYGKVGKEGKLPISFERFCRHCIVLMANDNIIRHKDGNYYRPKAGPVVKNASLISSPASRRRNGCMGKSMGFQIINSPRKVATLERYAVIFDANDAGTIIGTRADIIKRLRQLANAMETGDGAVWGEAILTGHELNAADYAPISKSRKKK
ncbi:hypothetical protein [Geminisphaera colitermitum]|uniref:hypothetical protein n=1 Tax=Geminisphaera colitermitum TaxID=1148786 RepID=UPI00019652CF|nr:hypothetical protein [Geminisphaera colitermitum]